MILEEGTLGMLTAAGGNLIRNTLLMEGEWLLSEGRGNNYKESLIEAKEKCRNLKYRNFW